MSNSKKMNPVFKVLIVLVVIAALAFGVYNIVWLVFYNQHIKPFRDVLDYDEVTKNYVSTDSDNYYYSISYYYLRFDAELNVSEIWSDSDPVHCLMHITVTPDGYDYNAAIGYQNDEKDELGNPARDTFSFHLNKDIQLIDTNGNVIEKLSDDEKEQYDKAYPELKILFDKANGMWTDLND